MSNVSAWSTTAASNNSASPDGFPEAMAPSGVNDAAREVMAAVRRWVDDGGWHNWGDTHTYASGTSTTVSGDVTARYPAGRAIRAVGAVTGTIYGKVASSSYSVPNTTVNYTWDSGSLSNETLTVSVGFITVTGKPVDVTCVRGAPTLSANQTWSGTNTFSGDVILGSSTVSAFIETLVDDADAATARATLVAEPQGVLYGINTQTDSYTLVIGDAGKLIEMNKATANNLTVPPNASVAFAVNTRIDIAQYGAGQTTVVAGSGVTIRSSGGKLKLRGQYSGATLYKRATDEWMLIGDITA